MAKLKIAKTDTADWAEQLRWALAGGETLDVAASPGARHLSLAAETADDGTRLLRIAIPVAPEDGKANEALLTLIATLLDRAPANVTLLKGQSRRRKVVRVARL